MLRTKSNEICKQLTMRKPNTTIDRNFKRSK